MIVQREWGHCKNTVDFLDVPISEGWQHYPLCTWADALFFSPGGAIGVEINRHGETQLHWVFAWVASQQPKRNEEIKYAPIFNRYHVHNPQELRQLLVDLTKEYEEENESK